MSTTIENEMNKSGDQFQMQSNAKKEEKRNNRRQAQAIHSDETPKSKHNLEIDIDKLVLENKYFKMVRERFVAGGGGGRISSMIF